MRYCAEGRCQQVRNTNRLRLLYSDTVPKKMGLYRRGSSPLHLCLVLCTVVTISVNWSIAWSEDCSSSNYSEVLSRGDEDEKLTGLFSVRVSACIMGYCTDVLRLSKIKKF